MRNLFTTRFLPGLIRMEGFEVHVYGSGRAIVVEADGRETLMPVEEYEQRLVARLTEEAPAWTTCATAGSGQSADENSGETPRRWRGGTLSCRKGGEFLLQSARLAERISREDRRCAGSHRPAVRARQH